MSNALLKSRAITATKSLLWSDVTLWRIEMRAAVVDPDGRKANWSERFREDGEDRKAGYRNWRTTMRSVILDSTEVIDIGRKSLQFWGVWILGTGVI